jgi:hypothetical protein
MKLAELRAELARLGLPTKGNKKALQTRLDAANSKQSAASPSHLQLITGPVEEVRGRMLQMFQKCLFSDVTVVVTSSSTGK